MIRVRHYNSLPFFEWLRKKVGIDKPTALGWDEWDDWKQQTRKNHPIGWFLTETLPKWLEKPVDVVKGPFEDTRIYLTNRFVTKTHILPTYLSVGKWHEFDERLMHGMFGALVDFVEVELAWQVLMWKEANELKEYGVSKPAWWKESRSAKAGLEELEWAASLTHSEDEGLEAGDPRIGQPTGQALAAQETLALYKWWTETRPSRGDSWDTSGLQSHWDAMQTKYGGDGFSWLIGSEKKMTEEEDAEYRRLSSVKSQLEKQWSDEDTEMMIRLVKLRKSLWT
jgi:hypothetical protein